MPAVFNQGDWLIDWLIDWLTDWLIDWLTNWLIYWLTHWLIDWLIDWLTDWLIDQLTDWLTEWFNSSQDCLTGFSYNIIVHCLLHRGSNRPFPSSLVPLFQNEYKCETFSYENEFYMQFHFHANQSHFHKNGFTLRLALKQRHKGTWEWPISLLPTWVRCSETITASN